jgi:hypothetical protein
MSEKVVILAQYLIKIEGFKYSFKKRNDDSFGAVFRQKKEKCDYFPHGLQVK